MIKSNHKRVNKKSNKEKLLLKLLFLMMLSSLVLPLNAAEKKIKLTVTVVNIEKKEGVIRLIVLSSKKAFESTPEESTALSDLAVVMRVTDKEMTVSFDGLSAGEYTIKVLHDVDENGKMTFNGLLPKEPYGFSNNARNVFSEPDYEDCTFQLVAGKDKEMSIEVK